MDTPSFKDDHISQVPALPLLIDLGYDFLSLVMPGWEKRKARMERVVL